MKFLVMKDLWVLLFLSFIASAANAQNLYEYRVQWFPGDAEKCDVAANAIAARFAANYGAAKVISAGCEVPYTIQQDVVIVYQAETEANIVSTYKEFVVDKGSYKTFKECESGLEEEKKIFTSKTGLPVVVSYCMAKAVSDASYPFISRIDGVGSAKVSPQNFKATIYERPEFSSEEMSALLSNSLKLIPMAELPMIRVDFASLTTVSLKYYSANELPLSFEPFVSFENMNVCRQYKEYIGSVLQSLGVVGNQLVCASERFSSWTRMYRFGLLTKPFRTHRVPRSFASRAQCQKALPEILTQYSQIENSVEYSKALCSFERSNLFADPAYFAILVSEQ